MKWFWATLAAVAFVFALLAMTNDKGTEWVTAWVLCGLSTVMLLSKPHKKTPTHQAKKQTKQPHA